MSSVITLTLTLAGGPEVSILQKSDFEIGSLQMIFKNHFSMCLLTGPAMARVEARKQLVELMVSGHSLLAPCGSLEDAQGLALSSCFLLSPLPPQRV